MSRIHIIQHVSFEGPGLIEKWAIENHHSISFTHLYKNDVLPGFDDFDLLVIMGGPMGIYDEDKFPWLISEKKFIKQAIQTNKKILGICLGSQLLADCLGTKVTSNNQKEIGWFPIVKKTSHPYFRKITNQPFTTFHWHGDTFDIPQSCSAIFSSDATINQGFVFNNQIIALQFHPEILPENLNDLIVHAGSELKETGAYIQSEENIKKMHSAFHNDNRHFLFDMLTQFANS